jgi:hypothetical protein
LQLKYGRAGTLIAKKGKNTTISRSLVGFFMIHMGIIAKRGQFLALFINN